MTSKPSPAKVSATDRMNMHVAMTLQLKEKPSGATATCKIPNCGAEVFLFIVLSFSFLKFLL